MLKQIISRLFTISSENVDVTPSGNGQETVRIDISVATTDYLQGYPVELNMQLISSYINIHRLYKKWCDKLQVLCIKIKIKVHTNVWPESSY